MKVLITQGDPKGIGPEITIKALKRLPANKRKKILLIGDKKTFERFGWNSNLCSLIAISHLSQYRKKEISFKEAGEISFKSLELSLKLISKNKKSALVTAPISKKSWNMAGIKYMGHTDYFRKRFKKELLMCFSKQNINTALITEHIPLKEVHKYIKKKNIVSKSLIFLDMIKNEKRKAKILFTGLNPHCGEMGLLGKEETNELIPAINFLKKKGINAKGPFNPEDIFSIYNKENVDGAIFMYHDQLIPLIKTINRINDIVHITWGLGFIRTSPTHGTAFDIAGKNIADETSMLNAIEKAMSLAKF